MPQVINTNVSSLNSQRALNKSQSSLSTSLQRLSSGLRINSAKDDAAGMAIASRMSAQISGLDTARRNANDGVSLSQTAESALSSVADNLTRMRDLAVQAANATNSDADRAALNQEITQLQAEIQRVGEQTEFNGRKLLDGSFISQFFQIGANAGQGVNVTLTDSRASGMGQQFGTETFSVSDITVAGDYRLLINGTEVDVSLGLTNADGFTQLRNAVNNVFDATGVRADFVYDNNRNVIGVNLVGAGTTFNQLLRNTSGQYEVGTGGIDGELNTLVSTAGATTGGVNNVASQTFRVNGNNTEFLVQINTGDSMKTIADKINAGAQQTGVAATARTTATLMNLGADGTISFQLNGKNDMPVTIAAVAKTNDLSELVGAINTEADTTGITARLSQDKSAIYLVNEEGHDIKITNFSTTAAANRTFDVLGANDADATNSQLDAAGTNSVTVGGRLTYDSENMFFLDTAAAGSLNKDIRTYSDRVSVDDINVNTLNAATRAIKVLDAAINGVNSARATLGAIQNRFDAAISNLQANSENLSAARSRIRDTDFALETSSLAMATILQQSGISVLAQANQVPNNVLTLLRQ